LRSLNLCESACAACVETNRRLMKEAEVNGPTTCHCFAGLCATAVPVKMGASVIGYLKTGQVFSKVPVKTSSRNCSVPSAARPGQGLAR
jgi:ligand-binding sensor protein